VRRITAIYLLRVGRPVTRHEMHDRYFYVGHPPKALDGGPPIPWQSLGARVAGLICRDPLCNHENCGKYIQIVYEGECPVTGERSQFIAPIGKKWAQRRLF